MNSTAYIVTTLVAFLLGQWLVTRKHWSGFLVWCVANIYSIVTCILTDMPRTSLLFAAYFIVNFASLRSWFANSRAASRVGAAESPGVTIQRLLEGRTGVVQFARSRVSPGTGGRSRSF
jgi:hypothetical protein